MRLGDATDRDLPAWCETCSQHLDNNHDNDDVQEDDDER